MFGMTILLCYHCKKRSSSMGTKPAFRRTLQWSSVLLLVFVMCLVSGLSTAVASPRPLISGAGHASAGHAASIVGAGKGSLKQPVLSASQRAVREQMLKRVHLPLAIIPEGAASSTTSVSAPAPSFLSKGPTGLVQPQASVFVGSSDLGVHTSSQI